MNLKRNLGGFLGTFANNPPAGFIPVVPEPPPAQIPAGYVPVAAVIDMADAMARRDAARSQLQTVRNQPAPVDAEPAPVATPALQSTGDNSELAKEMRNLRLSNERLMRQNQQQQMENYRLGVIANSRAAGHEMIDTLVSGSSPQEIDASVQFAIAEYRLIEQQIQRRNAAQAPPIIAGPPVIQAQAPAATVTSNVMTPQLQQQAPLPQEISSPGYYSAPGVPDTGHSAEIISPDVLAHLGSAESIRNGTYAANRQGIIAALRNRASRPPQRWSFDEGYQLGPEMPGPVGAPPAGTPPAMMGNPYAGVVQPQVQRGVVPAPLATQGMSPGVSYRPVPTNQNFVAPQPAQFDQPVAPGQYVASGVPTQGDISAARTAAVNAARSGGVRPGGRGQQVE